MGDGEELGGWTHGFPECFDIVLWARVHLDEIYHPDGIAESLGLFLEGCVDARMVVTEEENLIAGLQINATRDEVVSLGGAGYDYLLRRGVEKLGENAPGRKPGDRRPTSGDFRPRDPCRYRA